VTELRGLKLLRPGRWLKVSTDSCQRGGRQVLPDCGGEKGGGGAQSSRPRQVVGGPVWD
jgi:hypothetical protein